MLIRTTITLLASSLALLAQEPAATTAPPLPAAGTEAAATMVDQGIAKMLAFGRGSFSTSERRDLVWTRQAGGGFDNETKVTGGWQRHLVWAEAETEHYLRHGGLMAVKTNDGWRLRGRKLASGKLAPFTLDPDLLFTVLRDLPAEVRRGVHVEAGEIDGRKVAVLTLSLDAEAAAEFAETGVVPGGDGDGAFGNVFVAWGGNGNVAMPEVARTVHLALSIDPDNGDVLRFAAAIYEKNPMFQGFAQVQVVQFQAQGAGAAAVAGQEAEAPAEGAGEAKPAKPEWKDGLPTRAPEGNESLLTYRVDFSKLGLAEPPQFDDRAKELLRVR